MRIWIIITSYNKGGKVSLWSSRQRNEYEVHVNHTGWSFKGQARKKKRRTEQLSLGNGEVVALKLMSTTGHCRSLRNSEAPERFSSTLTERLTICGRGIQRNRWTEQLSIGNGKAMVLKLIKHDKTLEGLAGQLKEFFSAFKKMSRARTQRRGLSKEFWSAWTIENHANRTPRMGRGPRPSNAWVNALFN